MNDCDELLCTKNENKKNAEIVANEETTTRMCQQCVLVCKMGEDEIEHGKLSRY